ncbi:MAG: insulinase family protein [Ignavibacteriae bacterium]|nr:insulinase family protein [Ignavibacteriota bacterium]
MMLRLRYTSFRFAQHNVLRLRYTSWSLPRSWGFAQHNVLRRRYTSWSLLRSWSFAQHNVLRLRYTSWSLLRSWSFAQHCAATLTILSLLVVEADVYAQKPDRSRPPELGPPPTLQLPSIQRFQLSNGLAVVVMEKHQVPLVQMNLMVNAGTAMDPADQRGLSSMTAAMMEEGAGTRNALDFADAVDFLGANLSVNSGMHTTTVSLFTPLSKLDTALALFADVVLRPRFPAEELERSRTERLTTLLQWHDEPRVIGSTLFNRILFGMAHPYGPPTMGNEQTLRGFTVDQLRQFYQSQFRPDNATLIIVGDVTPSELKPKLDALLASWKSGAPLVKPTWPAAKQVEARKISIVDKPGAAQSVIRIGRIGVARTTEDYYAITVMNTILGASFTSRLNNNLREVHGYSYGANSRFNFMPIPGAFIAASDVQTDVTDKALHEFMKELRNISTVSDEELTRAKNYVALSYPSDFQSVGQIAGSLGELVMYSLPDDYFNNYTKNILAVSKDDVVRVAKKYVDPEKIAIIIVGDRKKIEKGIADLKLGPIENLSIEDVLGKPPVIGKK